MKISSLIIVFVVAVFGNRASAQVSVNRDSLKLVKRLTEDRAHLLELQSQVDDKTKEKEQTAVKAQESADENRRAADRLAGDPQDRKLARKADNAASDARSDAKKARRAADELDDLKKDIRDLTDRIDKNQGKLSRFVTVPGQSGAPSTAVVDSTKAGNF